MGRKSLIIALALLVATLSCAASAAQAQTPPPERTAASERPSLPRAADFSRRAAASLAKSDYTGADADFSRAIEVEPWVPDHRLNRARGRFAAGKLDLAIADLDEALRLKPDDLEALTLRARSNLVSGDKARAAADFAQAVALAPKDPKPTVAAINAYMSSDDYEAALVHLDRVIARWPENSAWSDLKNARCWVRVMLNRELEIAAADCHVALERHRRADYYDSRGLLRVRLGQWDGAIDDYNRALRLYPKLAWSLYGRGLAKVRKGQVAAGETEMATAFALDPTLRAKIERYGFTP